MFNIFADGQIIYQPGNDNLSLLSPKLTVEMGKAGSLEFSVPPTNRFYNTLYQIRTKLTVTMDGDEIFRGRVLSNKRSFNNVKEVYGEGNLSYLVDSCQKAKKYEGKAHALFRSIIAEHNRMIQSSEKQFTVGQITVEDRSVVLKGQSDDIQDLETNKFDYRQIAINSISEEWQNTYDYIESVLLEYCGGYLRTRYDAASGKTYIDWLKDYYAESTQTIQLGKNLLDMTEEISAEDLFTVLIPLGDENLTIEKVNNGSVELADANAVAKYGRIVKTNVFDGVTKPETLLENARRYLKNHVEVPTTYEIKAVDLHLINPSTRAIFVGDKVHVISPAHEIDNRDLVCTKIEYDLTNAANTTYTFGNPKQDLTERYRKNKKNDASRGGGGGGAAAQKAKEEGDEIWDAWVKVDAEHASIDIGALYEKLYPGTTTPNLISKSQILLGSDSNGTGIDLISKFSSDLTNISNQAGFTTHAGPDGAETVMYVTDTKTGDRAEIKLGTHGTVREERYQKLLYGDHYVDATRKVYEVETIAELTADVLKLNVDTIQLGRDVTTLKGKVVNLETDYSKIDSKILEVIADNLKITAASGYINFGGNVSVSGNLSGGTILVGSSTRRSIADHYHKMSVDSSGKVTLGTWVWDAAQASFNIADTAFYKEHVSASLDIVFDHSARTVKAYGVNAYGTRIKTATKVNSEQLTDADVEFSVSEDGKFYRGLPRVYGNSKFNRLYKPSGADFSKSKTDNTVYNNGRNSVSISSLTIQKNYVAGKLYSVTATAVASNNKSKETTVTV